MNISYLEAEKMGLIKKKDIPKQAKSKRKSDLEGDEQILLIDEFRRKFPEFSELLIHIPNGGSRRNKYEGYRLKRQGVKAGVSDLFLPVAKGGYIGLWLEYKATPPYNAAVSKSQKHWIELMKKQGYKALVCNGYESAMKELTNYINEKPTIFYKNKN